MEEVFHDANSNIAHQFSLIPRRDRDLIEESKEDPAEREMLPFFKDPKIRFSVWTILKDAIGKDLSNIQVPIYFNQPTNPLQQIASSFEYYDILEKAYDIPDPFLRLATICCMSCTGLT